MAALSHCPLIPCLFWNRSPSAVPHSCHITHLSLSRSFPWICKHSEPHLCCRPAHMHNTHTHTHTPALTSFQPDFSTSLPTCWSYFLHILLAMWQSARCVPQAEHVLRRLVTRRHLVLALKGLPMTMCLLIPYPFSLAVDPFSQLLCSPVSLTSISSDSS